MKLFFTVRPIYTCNFSCDFLLLMDVNEWIYYECSDEGTYTQNIKRQFFQCHVFAMKSVQNRKSFWRTSQNYFVLALFSSLYS